MGLLSGGSGSLRCACRRPDPRPRASGLRSRSRGSSDERRRPRRCWTRRICTAPSNSPTSSLCLCTGSAQTMTVPSSGGSPFASRRPGSSSRRRFAFHEQAALWNACVARLETTASGHREPRERRGRQCLRQHEGRARGPRSKTPRIRQKGNRGHRLWTRAACICTTGLGQRVRAVRRAYGLREKRAPETKPSPLRRGAGSRRSRSVGGERPATVA